MMRMTLSIMPLILLAACWKGEAAEKKPIEADNTGQNVRDREGETLTPIDQLGSKADLDLTAAIRKALMDEDALSVNAKNIKIITQDGVVTLRGPVETQAEKDRIEAIAKALPGVITVKNELEAKNP